LQICIQGTGFKGFQGEFDYFTIRFIHLDLHLKPIYDSNFFRSGHRFNLRFMHTDIL